MLPDPLVLPFLQAAVAGGWAAILPGEISPPGTGVQDPENAIDNVPIEPTGDHVVWAEAVVGQ